MPNPNSQAALRSLLYGSAATLLLFDIFFLIKAVFTDNFVPIVPITAGILTAAGLLFVVYAEHRAREADKRDHRRISRVAHQLETPLTTLQQDVAQLMARSERLPAEERMKLKRMETKTTVLLENVRDVFLMLQAQEKTISAELRKYDLCPVVEEVITKHQAVAAAHNVELTYKNHCEKAPAFIEKRLFKIAVSHVIENAIIYTRTPGQANIALVRDEKRIRIVVQDRGVGVKPEDAYVIFQPFARGAEAEKFDPDGIGVGLTVARLIIHEAGGTIKWKNRTPSAGAEFEIILPLAKEKK